jgi:hypothetical protein
MENDQDLLLISIFTFFTITLWVTFELLKTVKTTTVTTTTQQIIVPLNPKIDIDTVHTIANKQVY